MLLLLHVRAESHQRFGHRLIGVLERGQAPASSRHKTCYQGYVIKDVIKDAIKDVVKDVIKDVIKDAIKDVIKDAIKDRGREV